MKKIQKMQKVLKMRRVVIVQKTILKVFFFVINFLFGFEE